MRKRILSGLIIMAMIFSLLPQTISFAENDDNGQISLFSISNVTYQAQFCACYSGGGHRVGQCNVASMVNLLRRKAAYLGVNAYFSPNSVYRALGINDAQQTRCSKDGRVGYIYSNYVSGNTSTARTYVDENNVLKCTTANHSASTLAQFKSLLDQHPEGIFIGYAYPPSHPAYPGYHRIIITRYEGNQLYAVDPVYASRGEIRVESIYGYRSDLISNHYEIMTIDSTNVPEKPAVPVHTHSWTVGYDSGHPHKQYNYCSGCGEKEYSGMQRKVTSCKQCYPLGSARLTRSFNKVEGTAIFKRNDVKNATEYTVALNKDGSLYKTYKMTETKLSVTGLPVGKYTAKLTFKNGNTGETKTASTDSFKIVNTYTVSYNANGGSGAPSSQTKIQGENLTLSSSVPKKTGHIFKGWASTNKAKNSQYTAGGTYKKNAKITLYAVWEPETYTIKFDANGGIGEVSDMPITYGNTIRMPNSVVKDGFYLKGWSTNKNATNPDYRANMDYKLTANTQLYAVWGSSTWGGAVATEFAGGDGTEENPYQISNAGELAHLAKIINESGTAPEYKYYVLTDNISLGYEEWVPIGVYDNENQYFKGSFDGNGYTISDLSITQPNSLYIGLFGRTSDSTIKNISLTGNIIGITSNEWMNVGGLAGYSYNLNAENCAASYLNVSDISLGTEIQSNLGCLFGEVYKGNITNCHTNECYINLNHGWYKVGNFAGLLSSIDMSDCYVLSSEELIGTKLDSGGFIQAGGISGYISGNVVRCSVKAGYLSNSMKSKGSHIGGFVGRLVNGKIKQCSVNFNNSPTKTVDNTSYNCSIYATDTTDGDMQIGGFAGLTDDGYIEDCSYNGSSVVGINQGTLWGNIGGMVGQIKSYQKGDSPNANLNRCFMNINGIVYGESKMSSALVGGIAGKSYGSYSALGSNLLVIANKISAVSNSSTTNAFGGDITGYIEGSFDYDNTYSYSSLEVEAKNTSNTNYSGIKSLSSPRTLAQIKRAAFLKQVFGEPYQSLEYLKTHPDAVWVQKDGELPELYFNVLNDITVSDTENGTIAVDRTQAVDDEIVNVTASPAEGYELNKVYVNGKEIDGTTFAVEGDSDVFATFIEKTPEFSVEIEADANATATLTNVDEADVQLSSVGEFTLFSDEPVTELTASDGEEIKVTAAADEDYTVDAIYVNGEEIAGDSFILTDDTKVTLEVTSISTDTKAVTNDTDNVGSYFAMLSGSVEGDTEGVSRYIRYWEKDNPDEVFTTDVTDGAGEYSATIDDLLPLTTYQYQMTEFGEVKEFTTLHEDDFDEFTDGDGGEERPDPTTEPTAKPTTEPTTEPTEEPIKREICFEIQNQLKDESSVSADVVNTTDEAQSGLVVYVAYDGSGKLVKVDAETITDLTANATFPVEFAIADGAEKYKILVWDSWKSMLPIAASVDIE